MLVRRNKSLWFPILNPKEKLSFWEVPPRMHHLDSCSIVFPVHPIKGNLTFYAYNMHPYTQFSFLSSLGNILITKDFSWSIFIMLTINVWKIPVLIVPVASLHLYSHKYSLFTHSFMHTFCQVPRMNKKSLYSRDLLANWENKYVNNYMLLVNKIKVISRFDEEIMEKRQAFHGSHRKLKPQFSKTQCVCLPQG